MKNKINIFPTLLTNIILFAVLMLLILKIMNIDNKNMLLIENFSDFINICQDKVPQFYIDGGVNKGARSIYECGEDCSSNNCDFFTHNSSNNINSCYIYNNVNDVTVNCAANSSRKIPGLGNYKGQGFVKKNYYKSNKDKFTHNDYLLDQATNIKDEYMDIKSEGLKTSPSTNIWNTYNTNATNISNYLNLPTSKFYTYLNPDIDGVVDTKMQFMGEDISLIPLLKLMENEEQSLDNLESKYSNQNVKFDRQYLIYSILFFIMILTTIVLIIFKIYPNIISLKFIIFYFLGISVMLVFLQMFLNI
jgi:hypothetical protein